MKVSIVAKMVPMDSQMGTGELIGKIATICYGEKGTNYEKVVKRCIKSGHDSVLEHVSYTFRIDGISRVTAQQLTRHRIASYTMLSQRYTNQSGFDVMLPSSIADMAEVDNIVDTAQATYDLMISRGVKPEDARYILPQGVTCSLYMTMNVRSLRNFLELRLDTHAQAEIRDLATEILELVWNDAPLLFSDIVEDFTGGEFL